jgi:hypothetical protein
MRRIYVGGISPLAAAVSALVAGEGLLGVVPRSDMRRLERAFGPPPPPKPLMQADLDRIEAARLKRERRAAKRRGQR